MARKQVNLQKTPAPAAGSDPMLSAPVLLIELGKIADGENARGEVGDVSALAASMREVGLLNPITVREKKTMLGKLDGWTLVAGARRLKAARELGWKTIRATVADEVHAREAALAENLARVDLDPFEEAEALGDLVRRGSAKGDTAGQALEASAGKLGIPMRRARRRMSLCTLDASWRKRYSDGGVTLEALELLATLEPATRKALQLYGEPVTRAIVAGALRRATNDIAAAPFDTADCAGCVHRLGLVPDLFDARDNLGKLGSCGREECWDKRAAEALRAKLEKARRRNPDLVVTASKYEVQGHKPLEELAATVDAHYGASYVSCKKGDKGAVPVVSLTGMDAGKVAWKKPYSSSDREQKPQTPKEKEQAKALADDRKAARTKSRAIYDLPAWESDPVERWARDMLRDNPGKAVCLVLAQAGDALPVLDEEQTEQAVEDMSRIAHGLISAWTSTNRSSPLGFEALEKLLAWLDLPNALRLESQPPQRVRSVLEQVRESAAELAAPKAKRRAVAEEVEASPQLEQEMEG